MIYLSNNTEPQKIFIPKNDVDEAFVPHTYSEGYKDGIEYQKSLLSSTAFTENGEYSKEDGWSAVTVNVPTGSTVVLEEKTVVISADTTNVLPSSGYDGMSAVTIDATGYAQQNYDDGFDDGFLDGMSSGYTDGFESGYTSGETHQKSLLVSTAFTENGTYTREDGWNEVEVNYDSGSTYQSGYTSGYTDGYDSGYTSGHTDGEDAIISTFSSMTATTNGEYGSSANPLSSITVNVPQTGVSIPLTSITINSNTAITVSDKAYTGITVDVPLVYFDEYIHTNPLHSTNLLDYLIDTNIIPTTGTTMRVKGMNMGIWNGETIVGSDEPPYPSFRGFWTVDNIFYDWNGERINTAWTGNSQTNTGNTIDVTFGNYYIYDNVAEEMLVSGNTIQGWSTNMSIHVDVGSWWLKELEIWDGETKVFDGVAAHNSIGEVGLYDYVSQKMYTNSNINIVYENSTPSIEPNKSFTATSNGEYTIIPSNIWSITYDETFARTYDFTINGTIPQSEIGSDAYVVEYYDENTGEEPSVRIYISGSNVLSIDKSNWEEDDYGDVDFMLWQGKYRLEFDEDLDSSEFTVYHHNTSGKYDAMSAVTLTVDTPTVTLGTASFSANGTYSASTDNLGGYSALTVDVPQTFISFADYIHTDPLTGSTNIYIDTGIFPTTGTTMRIKYQGRGLTPAGKLLGFSLGREEDVYTGATDSTDYRVFLFSNIKFDYNYGRIGNGTFIFNTNGTDYDLTVGNYYIYDNINERSIATGVTQSENPAPNIPIMVNISTVWLKSLEIWEGETKVFDGNAAYDTNGNIGLFDSIGGELLTVTQTGITMAYEFSGPTLPLSSITFTANTSVTVTDKAYSAITVNVPTGSSATLGTGSFSANGTYSASTDNLDGYSAITINVPKTGGPVKYVEYIETDGTRVGWDTGLKVGSENSNFNIELDFMPLSGTPNDDAFYTFICDTDNYDHMNVFVRTWGGGYHLEKFQVLLGSIYNNSYSGFSSGNRYDLVLDYASNSGSVKSNNVDILPNQSVTLNSRNEVGNICINTWYVNGEVHRCPLARYYKVNIIIDGVEHTFNPCLDENDVPCFYDEYNQTYLYNIGTGNTPTAGPVLPTPDYISGHTQGMKDALENSLYGAYYPVDIATNKSYCTYFPDLESGKTIYFDIISTSSRQANKMLGGDYSNRDEHYLMIGYDNSNREIDIQINAKGTPSGITSNAYLTLFYPTSGSIVYNSNQRICGEIAVTDTECNYGVACLGFVPNKNTVQGNFSGSYPIKFNQDFASAFTLCRIVYKDTATGEIEHFFAFDPSTNEIKDYITGNLAQTYDSNGNQVSGVLEPNMIL